MPISIEEGNKFVIELLEGTSASLKSIFPLHDHMTKPTLLGQSLHVQYAVLIGITDDIKGKLILAGDPTIFGYIGESMFGMPLEGEMLESFSGELGNMIAGGLSTNVAQNGISIDITAPTIIRGEITLSGYNQAIGMNTVFNHGGELEVYLLLD